jgi:SAM-dependent methyltransferase
MQSRGQELIWKSEDILAYHERQFDTPYRSTVHLGRFMKALHLPNEADVLEVGCGAGAPIHHLAPLFPGFRWTGVDFAGDVLFPLGRPRLEEAGIHAELINGDFFKLTEIFGERKFNIALSIQTLSSLPAYQTALEQLLAITKNWVIISSLFTEFEIDARIEVIDYSRPDAVREPEYYNVYSLKRFREECELLGFTHFVSEEFEMDVDLPVEHRGRGTFTRTLADGRRLQFSGPLHLPWRFVAMQRSGA